MVMNICNQVIGWCYVNHVYGARFKKTTSIDFENEYSEIEFIEPDLTLYYEEENFEYMTIHEHHNDGTDQSFKVFDVLVMDTYIRVFYIANDDVKTLKILPNMKVVFE